MAKKHKNIRHGAFLTIMLVVIVMMNLLTLVLIIGRVKSPEVMSYPYLMATLLVISAAKVVAAFGIWFWERWALYVYAIAVVATIIVGLLLTGTWLFAFNEILPLAILGWLLRDKYDHFS